MQDDQSVFHSPEPITPAGSPLWPRHLVDIFVAPRRFFSGQLALGERPYFLAVLYCFGVASTLDRLEMRIQQNLLTQELRGAPRPAWEFIEPFASNWAYFWAYGLAGGVLAAALIWWIGGWWFKIRVGWSGAQNPDPRKARLVYIYASVVWVAPYLALTLGESLAFENYLAAWRSESLWPVLFLIFPVWSAIAGYKGVMTLFEVKRGRAIFWFAVLPSAAYVLFLGGLGTFFYFLGKDAGA